MTSPIASGISMTFQMELGEASFYRFCCRDAGCSEIESNDTQRVDWGKGKPVPTILEVCVSKDENMYDQANRLQIGHELNIWTVLTAQCWPTRKVTRWCV